MTQAALFICEECNESFHECPRGGFHGPWAYSEAPDDVKEKAIQHRQRLSESDDFDTDFLFDDFETVAELLGITIDSTGRSTKHRTPAIYYSGFCSQGDGACFEGSYSYKKGAVKAIKEHAPRNEDLHRIAKGLQDLQRPAFYQLTATVRHTGNYFHAYSTTIDVYNLNPRTGEEQDTTEAQEEAISELLRDFMQWMYKCLEAEYDYQTGEEAAREYLNDADPDINEEGEEC